MDRHGARILVVVLAVIMAHIAVHEWCDVSPKYWVVKGKLGQFGYAQWDYRSATGDRYGLEHNTTSIYLGPLKMTAPLSAASLLMTQVTVPLLVWSLVRKRKSRQESLEEGSANASSEQCSPPSLLHPEMPGSHRRR